jgi:hypothetical protein
MIFDIIKTMSLLKKAESYKSKMGPDQYKTFMSLVNQSVDLSAKNTKNKQNKDLAELQIEQLADSCKKMKTKTKASDCSHAELLTMSDQELFDLE